MTAAPTPAVDDAAARHALLAAASAASAAAMTITEALRDPLPMHAREREQLATELADALATALEATADVPARDSRRGQLLADMHAACERWLLVVQWEERQP